MELCVKMALRLAAVRRMKSAGYMRNAMKPHIKRTHCDGPMHVSIDGSLHWLSLHERIMTKIGVWDEWDIEWRRFPLPGPTTYP